MVNIYGIDVVRSIRENYSKHIKEQLKGVKLEEDIFNDIELPISYNPEKIILDLTKDIIEDYVKNDGKIPEAEKVVYQNYIMKIFDYSTVFDDVYEALLMRKGVGSDKILRVLHLMLAMEFTIRKSSESCNDLEMGRSYYETVKKECGLSGNYFVNLNYTGFLEKTFGKGKGRVNHIYGRLGEYLRLSDGRVLAERDIKRSSDYDLVIPNFVPQSMLKPIVSVEMIGRYYRAYEAIRDAERLIIVGFGFKRDDTHVVNMIKSALMENANLDVYIYSGKDVENSQAYKELEVIASERVHDPVYYTEEKFEDFLKEIKC